MVQEAGVVMPINIYIINFLIGLAFVGEFGQVNTAIVRAGLTQGLSRALLIIAGAICADAIYLVLTLEGILALFSYVAYSRIFSACGGAALIYFGSKGLYNLRFESIQKVRAPQGSHTKRYYEAFREGFLLNFVHPTNCIWWMSVLGPSVVTTAGSNRSYAYALGLILVLGSCVGCVLLATVAALSKSYVGQNTVRYIIGLSSCVLVLTGIIFILKAFAY